VAYDIDPRFRGYEMWGSRGGLMSATGVQISTSRPGQMNFCAWWDADVLRETLDGTTVYKWDWNTSQNNGIFGLGGLSSNNGTKSTPCLSADILGDWREEIIWRTSDNLNLRVCTTTTLATNRLYTLMHDPQYRCAIAWQNTGYNQPPHPGFFIGQNMFPPPLPPVSTADLVWRGGGANTWDAGITANWFTNNLWVSNNTSVAFANGKSVLLDLSGSNSAPVNLSGTLSPGAVTVYSPRDYSIAGPGQWSGSMTLVKAGQGSLTIGNTNNFTGGTFVRGGALWVNGTLGASAVTVERRGTPEGPSQIGGTGRLGAGLTVQAGCAVIVGAGTNSPGTLTVSNNVTELGSVLNRFDLSNDASGVAKTNDVIDITGNLVLAGTNIIEITQLNEGLAGGVYPLFKYTGTLTGGLSNLVLSGTFIQPVALTNPPGMIALLAVIPSAPPVPPSALSAVAVGAFQINLSWTDNSSDENAFRIERSLTPSNFTLLTINAANDINYSDTTVSPNTTYYYRVSGTNLAGVSAYSNTNSATTTPPPTSLTWRGDGAGNVWDTGGAVNWSDGANLVVFNDGAAITFDQTGSNNTPIAVMGTVQPNSVTVNATKSYTFGGVGILGGSMALTKSGSGTLTINTTNTFSGGVSVNSGVVSLGNSLAAGNGALRFNGGSVTFSGGGQPSYANPLVINANGTLTSAGANNNIVSGTWTGTNTTLNVVISATGTFTMGGNMNGFFGTLALGNSGGFCRFNGSSGSANTIFDLGTGTSTLNNRNGVSAALGALSGGSGTFVNGATSMNVPTTYTIGGRNLSTTYNGTITNNNAAQLVNITKVGSGTLTLNGNNGYLGVTTVSAGKLMVNGNQSAATGAVVVNAGGTLGGSGIIGGVTTVSGVLAPGNSIGALTFTTNLTFNPSGSAVFELMRVPLANDVAHVLGTVNYGGTLDVVNISPDLLLAGDQFQLFDAAAYNGTFNTFNLPPLEEGLDWNTSRLAVDGRIWVVKTQPPAISGPALSAGNFIFSGTGGTPNWYYTVLTSTNLALPVAQWTIAATNTFDAAGSFNFIEAIDPNAARKFYLIRVQ
jgi:fibronectin-binding autotransporter adhesin